MKNILSNGRELKEKLDGGCDRIGKVGHESCPKPKCLLFNCHLVKSMVGKRKRGRGREEVEKRDRESERERERDKETEMHS